MFLTISSAALDGIRSSSQTIRDAVLSKLPTAEHAAFDSHVDEHEARCHPDTRVDLQQEIMAWAENPHGECIFWLNGMAGTGKSTISRTVAQYFSDKGVLGASFFFKRGERDRGNAARLFPTIAAQLVVEEPTMAAYVRATIDADPFIPHKALKQQFEKLILEPLQNLKGDPNNVKTIVLVIDALDECGRDAERERDGDVRLIIHLLSQAKKLSSVRLRAFLTSRPELLIRLGFSKIKGRYQDLVLHDIPEPIIEHDIATFLQFRFTEIRDDYNALYAGSKQEIPLEWPGPEAIHTLVQMAVPLFIFAATVCRFIEEPGWSPRRQLEKVLQHQSRTHQSEIDKLDATYGPVLDRLLIGPKAAQRSRAEVFCTVVGSIVLLAEPLSIRSLACLLGTPEDVVFHQLQSLQSVLRVPVSVDSPVRTFHLSFRDFLVDPLRNSNPLWVDEKATNERIATRCLELLSRHLKMDVCDLVMPGTARVDIEPSVIDTHLPSEARYACLYWVYHLEQSSIRITDSHPVYRFLKQHFLHWLEALSLLGKASESISMFKGLQVIISVRYS